jgi:hypothetical protein
LLISAELLVMMEVPEAEVTGQGIPVEAGAHVVVLEGLLSLFS